MITVSAYTFKKLKDCQNPKWMKKAGKDVHTFEATMGCTYQDEGEDSHYEAIMCTEPLDGTISITQHHEEDCSDDSFAGVDTAFPGIPFCDVDDGKPFGYVFTSNACFPEEWKMFNGGNLA